jgi:SAM-dependent methyltransferase
MNTKTTRTRLLLERACPLLRCPACLRLRLEVLTSGPTGLACDACGRVFIHADGVLNLYTGPELFTGAQRSLQSRMLTALYERFRWLLAKAIIGCTSEEEVDRFERTPDLKTGDALLDVACGPGNFTLPLARRAAPGLVIGLDISPAQLARAAANVARADVDNVLLVRGDVHRLPLRDGAVPKVNCAGGLHQFPDPAKALDEIARVLSMGGRFSGSTLQRHPSPRTLPLQEWLYRRWKVHFVDLAGFRALVERAGLANYRHEPAPIPWFGYYQAAKA